MMRGTPADYLNEGRAALSRGAWRNAREAFESALALEESAQALEGLGAAAWWLDDGPAVFHARERAYQLYRKSGERIAAARLATELAEDSAYFRGEPAVAGGWLKRARRLLDGEDLAPEHGWLKLIEGDIAISMHNDPAAARAFASAAQAVGRTLGLVDLEMLALALEGLALVSTGNVAEGMPQLDEAAAAATSGEMTDPLAIGFACCYLVTACERARDLERAAQWCERVRAFCERTQFSTLFAVCRIQYAAVLLWRGVWSEAEKELLAAVETLAASHPAMQREGLVHLAELRRRQGRIEEAAAFLTCAEGHRRALLAGAALALDKNDPDTAARLARRFLRQAAAANLPERVAGLDLIVRAELSRGDIEAGAVAFGEIRNMAAEVSTVALRAAARAAEGLLAAAQEEHDAACLAFEDGIDLYGRSGTPFEKARTAIDLARSLIALGKREAAEAELRAAREALIRLDARPEAEQADKLLNSLRRSGSGPVLSLRETEVLRLLAQGLSNKQIANRLKVSEHTAKRHVANILTKLNLPTRAAAAAYAVRERLL